MTKPNMTLAEFNRWTNSQAFKEYKADHDGRKVNAVVARTKRYLKGNASKSEEQKVESFISRMKADTAGKRKYGKGRGKISARSASLLNWGFNPGVSF